MNVNLLIADECTPGMATLQDRMGDYKLPSELAVILFVSDA